jgi:hypothetical protein
MQPEADDWNTTWWMPWRATVYYATSKRGNTDWEYCLNCMAY